MLGGATHVHLQFGVGGDGQQHISPDHVVLFVKTGLVLVSDKEIKVSVTRFRFWEEAPPAELTAESRPVFALWIHQRAARGCH